MKIIMILLLISNAVLADSAGLKKGEKAPFDGVLLTYERAEKAAKAERSNIVLSDLKIAQDDLIDYHKTDAKKQREKLSEAKFDSWLGSVAFFVLGSVLTAVAFKIVEKTQDI